MKGPPLGPGGEDITWPDQVASPCRRVPSTRKINPQTSNHIRALDYAHTRLRGHTHNRHNLTTQIRLYTTNNSKQGLNSIHTLFTLPNTIKLKQNFPTTAENKQTLRSSAQTNMSAE